MLSKHFNTEMDPTGYWASEKLDGVRCIFINGRLMSRNNNIFNAPKWFVDNISQNIPSSVILDGELFTKRGDFAGVMGIVTKKIPIDSEWKQISFVLFDIPSIKDVFEERMKGLKTIVNKIGSKNIKMLNQIRVRNTNHLEQIQQLILSKGGEGVMLRRPGSFYEHKRSNTLLKVKTFMDDEAVVVDHKMGSGKYEDVLGHLIVKWYKGVNKGIQFSIGSGISDQERKSYKRYFPKGTIVKFKYFEVNASGKPRFPTFLGVRDKTDI
jgi:DNA ligase-1